jgi:monoamine oxidase
MRRFVMGNDQAYFFGRGRKERIAHEENFRKHGVYKLNERERDKTPWALWEMSVTDALKVLSDAEKNELDLSNVFTTAALRYFDELSLRKLVERARPEALGRMPLSEEAIEYMLFCYGNFNLQHNATTEFLREEYNKVWDLRFDEIEHGTSELPKAFATRLNEKPRMGCEVFRLEQTATRAVARYRRGGTVESAEGDYLLCTIPFPVLARLETNFSPAKQGAIRDIWYDSGTKVALLTRERFWEKNDKIFGGSSTTDLMTGPIFYPSDNAPVDGKVSDPQVSDRPGVLLASYTWGQDARRLASMAKNVREDFTIAQVSKVHPELAGAGMVLAKDSWAWDTHPWAAGAFAFYMPGQFGRIHRHVVAPEGRIHFAGEHCSRSHSWMEGALDSAEQAVKALLAR